MKSKLEEAFELVSHFKGLLADRPFDNMIGRLDRLLSELIDFAKNEVYDKPDEQTLKHHAEDMIGAGNKILELMGFCTKKKQDHRIENYEVCLEIVQDYDNGKISAHKALGSLKIMMGLSDGPIVDDMPPVDPMEDPIWRGEGPSQVTVSMDMEDPLKSYRSSCDQPYRDETYNARYPDPAAVEDAFDQINADKVERDERDAGIRPDVNMGPVSRPWGCSESDVENLLDTPPINPTPKDDDLPL